MLRLVLTLGLLALLLAAGCNENKTTATTQSTQTPTIEELQTRPDAPPPAKAGGGGPVESAADLVGRSAPDFTLADFDGKEHSLSKYTAAGKIVVLDWFDYECPASGAYYSSEKFLGTMNTAMRNSDDVVWLSVSSSAEGKPGYDAVGNAEYAKKVGKVNPTLRDPTGLVGKKYAAKATPTVFVIGRDGKVVYTGAFDQANGPQEAPKGMNFALLAVDAARKGNMPDVTSTRAFGCSVKYAE